MNDLTNFLTIRFKIMSKKENLLHIATLLKENNNIVNDEILIYIINMPIQFIEDCMRFFKEIIFSGNNIIRLLELCVRENFIDESKHDQTMINHIKKWFIQSYNFIFYFEKLLTSDQLVKITENITDTYDLCIMLDYVIFDNLSDNEYLKIFEKSDKYTFVIKYLGSMKFYTIQGFDEYTPKIYRNKELFEHAKNIFFKEYNSGNPEYERYGDMYNFFYKK